MFLPSPRFKKVWTGFGGFKSFLAFYQIAPLLKALRWGEAGPVAPIAAAPVARDTSREFEGLPPQVLKFPVPILP
jgi:hypothetical protein